MKFFSIFPFDNHRQHRRFLTIVGIVTVVWLNEFSICTCDGHNQFIFRFWNSTHEQTDKLEHTIGIQNAKFSSSVFESRKKHTHTHSKWVFVVFFLSPRFWLFVEIFWQFYRLAIRLVVASVAVVVSIYICLRWFKCETVWNRYRFHTLRWKFSHLSYILRHTYTFEQQLNINYFPSVHLTWTSDLKLVKTDLQWRQKSKNFKITTEKLTICTTLRNLTLDSNEWHFLHLCLGLNILFQFNDFTPFRCENVRRKGRRRNKMSK